MFNNYIYTFDYIDEIHKAIINYLIELIHIEKYNRLTKYNNNG